MDGLCLNIYLPVVLDNNHDTRNKNDIHATNINYLNYGGRKFNYKGRNYSNNLPVELKQETKIKT